MSLKITAPKISLMPLLGIILIILAGWNYTRDRNRTKTLANAANIIRMCASMPIAAVGIAPENADAETQKLLPMYPPAAVSNLISALQNAEPETYPTRVAPFAEWRLIIIYTNQVTTLLNATTFENRKDDVFVSLRQPVKADSGAVEWNQSLPALLPNAATFFYELSAESAIKSAAALEAISALAAEKAAKAALTNDTATVESAAATNTVESVEN